MEKDGDQMYQLKGKSYHNGFLILLNFLMSLLNDLETLRWMARKSKVNAKKLDWKIFWM